MKYYFETQDSEICYTKDHFIDEMKEMGITEMQVYPAIVMKGEPFFWCGIICTCFEKGESTCGKYNCDDYKPRNGKNGRCKFHKHCYVAVDDPITIRLTGTELSLNPELKRHIQGISSRKNT